MIQRQKIGFGHIDFAADFQHIGGTVRQLLRQLVNRFQIGGNVFAGGAVAAGGALNESTALIAGGERKSVDFRLGHEFDVFGNIEKAFDADGKFVDFLKAEDVAQRKHGKTVLNFAESVFDRGADSFGRAVGANQFREAGFNLPVAPFEGVVFGVGQVRRVVLIVGNVGFGHFRRNAFQFGGCLFGG